MKAVSESSPSGSNKRVERKGGSEVVVDGPPVSGSIAHQQGVHDLDQV